MAKQRTRFKLYFHTLSQENDELIDDNSKKSYYENNKNNFKIPKLRNVSYISFTPNLFYEEIFITDDQLKVSYNERINEFKNSESRNYFQVIFKTKQKATNFYNNVKKIMILLIRQNFLILMSDIKFDEITKDDLSKNIKDKIFQTYKTGLMQPFKTSFGFHVVQINKINNEKIKLLNEVSDIIKKDLIHNLAIEKLYEKIESINDLAFSGNNLIEIVKLSKIKNLKINKLFNVSRNGKLFTNFKPKNSNLDKKMLNKIWNLELNEVSELLEINENEFVLVNIDNEIEEKQLTYLDAEKLVSEKLYEKLIIKNTKLKSEYNYKNENSKNLSKILNLKRIDNKNLSNIFNDYVVNSILNQKSGK